MSKDLSEELGELLDDCNVQVTMTGWKAELTLWFCWFGLLGLIIIGSYFI